MSITIGIPFTRVDDDLMDAIRSVFCQTYPEWQLILYGDGVSFEDAKPLYSIDDSRLRILLSESSAGLASTLNAIAENSNTEFLFRMDSDDVMAQTRLQVTIDFFSANPKTDIVGTRAVVIDEFSAVQGLLCEPGIPVNASGFLRSNVFTHPTVAARTEWFRNNQYDPTFMRAQDKELWLRTCVDSNFAKIDEPLFYYRIKRSLANSKTNKSAVYDRRSVRMYGPRYAGAIPTGLQLLRSYLSQGRSRIFTLLGMADRAYARRFEKIDGSLMREYMKNLNEIRSYELPCEDSVQTDGVNR